MDDLSSLSSQELNAAVSAITADDEHVSRFARDIQKLIGDVNAASRGALAKAAELNANDTMNVIGKERLLRELPLNLMGQTTDALKQAEDTLGVIEALHQGAVLRHDSRQDAALIFEVGNYIAPLTKETAVATLVQLASNPRYSTFLAGPAGLSLASRFGLKDPGILQKVALQTLATDGTEDQIRRSSALASIERMRRVIGLAKAGRDNTAQEVRRRPKPEPSTALMS